MSGAAGPSSRGTQPDRPPASVSHRLVSVVWHERGGFRARCECRWRSARYPHQLLARRAWQRHSTG